MNWIWVSHFTKDNEDTKHMNEIHTHTPEDREPARRMSNKESQTATSQHSRSATSDAH